ncbi:MAG: hypothetical protein A2Z72_06275 [Omnitrophica bacterium RBG_13_46_9]|nr:MAG: hypothetical protein A2Z72_06275 [Omnitrophica bacterium RBG_13_46_9]
MIKIDSLYTFLTRLSKREKTILYVTVFFVSVTLLDKLIISPIFYKINSLDAEIREKELSVKKDIRMLSQKDRIMAESAKYASFLSEHAKSEEEETTFILKEIENLANQSSVYLIDMKPGGIKSTGQSKEYIVNLSCEAQLEQITEFMYKIENSKELLTIEKYEIEPKSKESSIARCSMSISKISM